MCLVLQYFAFNNSLIITIIFWTVLAPNYNRDLSSPLNIHVHAVVLLMMIIDVLFTKTPVHLIAFVYHSIYYLVYIIFTYLLHTAKITSEIYSFLNYEKNSLKVFVWLNFSSILCSFLCQMVAYSLYRFRVFVCNSCMKQSENIEVKKNLSFVYNNIVFQE